MQILANHEHYEINFETLMAAQAVKQDLRVMIKTPQRETL